MRKQAISISRIVVAALVAATFSLPLMSAAQAAGQRDGYQAPQCRIVGSISHRCLNFHSDSMWREGLADYHGSNGG
jgi:hypothetical protein